MSNHCCDGYLAPSPNAATQTQLAQVAGERPRPAPDAPGEPRNPRDSSAGRMGGKEGRDRGTRTSVWAGPKRPASRSAAMDSRAASIPGGELCRGNLKPELVRGFSVFDGLD
jgi:hypothetical protein